MYKHLATLPLTLIPLVVYIIIAFTFPISASGYPEIWDLPVFTVTLISGGKFTPLYEHLLIIFGLVFLFFEILKSTRQTSQEIYEHMFSMIVFIIYLVLFLTVGRCAHAVFFIMMVISLIDVVAGFMVTIRTARRSLAVENDIAP